MQSCKEKHTYTENIDRFQVKWNENTTAKTLGAGNETKNKSNSYVEETISFYLILF